MKSRILVCVVAAASLGASSLSFAQASGYDAHLDTGRPGELYPQNGRQFAQHDRGRDPQQGRGHDNRRDDNRHDNRPGNRGDNRGRHDNRDHHVYYGNQGQRYYYDARGPDWRRGGYIPREYRSRQYVVNDWRGHHLYAPPRGHEWVQVGSDYVLIAIATGVIAQLLLSH
ncbi:MAG: RcnB family protein [Ramlibacter sp.]